MVRWQLVEGTEDGDGASFDESVMELGVEWYERGHVV